MDRFIAFLFLLLLSFPAFSATFKNDPPLSGDMASLKVFPAPQSVEDVSISSPDGGTTLASFKGSIVIMNLWATWCPPCIEELPSLNALQFSMDKKYVQVVTVSLDTTGLEAGKKYLTEHNLMALPPYIDLNHSVQGMQILDKSPGIPITLILDPQMRALAMLQGNADWNGAAARAVIEYYMKNVSYAPVDTSTFMQ